MNLPPTFNHSNGSFGEPAEIAALYVCGALSREESEAFESFLRGPDAKEYLVELRRLENVVDALARCDEETPPAAVREALMARARRDAEHRREDAGREMETSGSKQPWKSWSADQESSTLYTLHRYEGEWAETGVPGIQVRRLFVDRGANRMTAMFKMAAGTAYPRHVHADAEECYVLEGDLHVEDIVLRAGDYQRAGKDSQHGVQWTEGGCVLLIVSSLSDEMDEDHAN
jgi:quercetin dioxygenase-like cupin family protein